MTHSTGPKFDSTPNERKYVFLRTFWVSYTWRTHLMQKDQTFPNHVTGVGCCAHSSPPTHGLAPGAVNHAPPSSPMHSMPLPLAEYIITYHTLPRALAWNYFGYLPIILQLALSWLEIINNLPFLLSHLSSPTYSIGITNVHTHTALFKSKLNMLWRQTEKCKDDKCGELRSGAVVGDSHN